MRIDSIIMITLYSLLILIMLIPKTKNYLKVHPQLATAILYTFLSIWFTRVIITGKMIQSVIEKNKTNGLYIFLLLFYIGIPLYFLYKAIDNYILYFKLEKKEKEKEKNKIKENNKKKKTK